MSIKKTGRESGFTLAEAVIVIVITGIIGAIVAVFIKSPVQAYFDTARRAELTDIADTALRRMARDIQRALPNSTRVDATGQFVEFLPIKDAGRYRAEVGANPGIDDPLDFSDPTDSTFEVFGPAVNVANGDFVAIYNLGIPGSDAYDGTSIRPVTTNFGSLTTITFAPGAAQFPFASPGSRFQVINTSVSYACQPNAAKPANGHLYRYSGYPIQPNQPDTLAKLDALATRTVVADNVSGCSISYNVTLQHLGLVSILLQLTKDGETVSLMHQVNVDNTP